jgi:hypothetical protein
MFRLRARTLQEGILNLLGENLTREFYSHPLIKGFARTERNALDRPSYIQPRIFVWVLFDLVSPEWVSHPNNVDEFREAVERFAEPTLRHLFLVFLGKSMGNVTRLQSEVELWFFDAMDRMAERYKMKMYKILFLLGFVVSFVLNADAVMIANTLSISPVMRSAISKIVDEGIKKAQSPDMQKDSTRIMEMVQTSMQDLNILGWSTTPGGRRQFPSSLKGLILKLLGLSITAASIAFISPCLFDLLNKFVNIRSTGRKPVVRNE